MRVGRMWVLVGAVVFAAGVVGATPEVAHADTLVGCDTAGLVAAINAANAAGGGTLDLAARCMYKLTAGTLPAVTTPITIHGNGATIERVANAPQFRLIAVSSFSGSLAADALTLTGGNDPAGDGGGGGIYNNLGTVSLTDCTVSGNVASGYGQGGGIENSAGTVVLTNTAVSGNTAGSPGGGGGIGGGVANEGSLTVTNSTISGNTAYAFGGGIYSDKYTFLHVSNSVISGNNTIFALSEGGGGIRADSVGGMALVNSTISGNVAGSSNNGSSSGGGVAIGSNAAGGAMSLTNLTISDNSATSGAGVLVDAGTVNLTNSSISGNSASGSGGGAYINNGGTVTLTYSTISGNTSLSASGGGISNTGTVTTSSSIVAENPGGDCSNAGLSTGGYNLDGDGTCGLTASTDKPGVDPQLGPLQGNGGPTETMAPAPTSPVVNAIPQGANGCGTAITTDQRGVSRPNARLCDIGAYETGDVATNTLTATPKSVASGANVTYSAMVVNSGAVDATGVTVTDTLPSGLTFVAANPSLGDCSFVEPTVTCALGQLPAATNATLTITVTVTAAAKTRIADTATVSATTGDTIRANDAKTAKIKVT